MIALAGITPERHHAAQQLAAALCCEQAKCHGAYVETHTEVDSVHGIHVYVTARPARPSLIEPDPA